MNKQRRTASRHDYNSHQRFILTVLSLLCLTTYLFASAPPPLSEIEVKRGMTIPIEEGLRIIADENAVARALYTKDIVGPGIQSGIAFDENWRLSEVFAGPLPALFLRETAGNLERQGAQLRLFLGSDFPIEKANRFVGSQDEAFFRLRKTKKAMEYFVDQDTQLHTAMFPDFAVAKACVDCHNDHPQTTKNDWKLNEMMGATTWSIAKSELTMEELLDLLGHLRSAIQQTYRSFLEETATWPSGPSIGKSWPREGFFLPDEETFMEELSRRASGKSLETLVKKVERNDGESTR